MKNVFNGKKYFNKGTRYEVLQMSNKAVLLQITKAKRPAYQVLDACEDYPDNEDALIEANVYRTVNKELAEEEYKKRNQLSI